MSLKAKLQVYLNLLTAYTAVLFARAYSLLGNKNKAAEILKTCSNFCWYNYPGAYGLKAIENLLIEIAESEIKQEKQRPASAIPSGNRKLKILHVITEGYETGGHVRLMINWIKADGENQHTIVFVNSESEIPTVIFDLKAKIPSLMLLKLTESAGFIDKARELRSIYAGFDLTILHHHPYDVVAVMSCASINIPPVAIMNHADHVFWIGASVADVLISIRTGLSETEEHKRQISKVYSLPVPVSGLLEYSYAEARKSLDISDDQVVLLTMASSYKLSPKGGYNFYASMTELLHEFSNVVVYIIGVDDKSNWASEYKHERLRFCGVLSDPGIYESACDIYVESFPLTSLTSLLQVAAKNKVFQLIYEPENISRCFFSDLNELQYPESYPEWKSQIKKLITDKYYRERVREVQFNYISETHVIEKGWPGKLKIIYNEILSMKHSYHKLSRNNWIMTSSQEIILNQVAKNMVFFDLIPAENVFSVALVKVISNCIKLLRRVVDSITYRYSGK